MLGMQKISDKVSIKQDGKFGWHLLTIKDIAIGEIIMEEQSLLITPHWDCNEMKCSKCFQTSYAMCRKCNFFPLCLDCNNDHDEFDCNFMRTAIQSGISKNLLVKNYAIFGVLKYLLLWENPKMRKFCIDPKVIDLANATDARWKELNESVISPLLESGLAEHFKEMKLNQMQLEKMCLLLDMHSYEILTKDGKSAKAVYTRGAMLPHRCVPQTIITLDKNNNMQIYAAQPIKTGQLIYNTYTNPLMGTVRRQLELRLLKNIECRCMRCIDDTELGTHMSSIYCFHCKDGLTTFKCGTWRCINCLKELPSIEVEHLIENVDTEMDAIENGDITGYARILHKFRNVLHKNHYRMLDIKQRIVTHLSEISTLITVDSNQRKILDFKLQLLQDIIAILRIVEPGLSKLYAIALCEQMVTLLQLSKLQFTENAIEKFEYHMNLSQAKDITIEIENMMSLEPFQTLAHKLVQCATSKRNEIMKLLVEL